MEVKIFFCDFGEYTANKTELSFVSQRAALDYLSQVFPECTYHLVSDGWEVVSGVLRVGYIKPMSYSQYDVGVLHSTLFDKGEEVMNLKCKRCGSPRNINPGTCLCAVCTAFDLRQRVVELEKENLNYELEACEDHRCMVQNAGCIARHKNWQRKVIPLLEDHAQDAERCGWDQRAFFCRGLIAEAKKGE